MNRYHSTYLAPAFVIALLFGIAAEKNWFHLPGENPEPYHERVRLVADQTPYQIGDWVGTDVEVPQGAVNLLRPNVLLSRRFRNLRTGQHVSMLLVQCEDARDLLGHYPPVCYPASGWTMRSAKSKDWSIGGLMIHGMEYEFSRSGLERSSRMLIDNFMLLPDGTVARDMDSIHSVAQDNRRKNYGAAQIQVVFDVSTSSVERDKIFQTFIKANMAIIETIVSGAANES